MLIEPIKQIVDTRIKRLKQLTMVVSHPSGKDEILKIWQNVISMKPSFVRLHI